MSTRRTTGKRGNREGSIYLDASDGRWCAVISTGDGRRRKFHGKTRAEAARKLAAALKAQQDGAPVPSEQETVARFLTSWLSDSVKHSVRPATFTSYETITRVHLIPELGRIRLARLSPEDVQGLLRRKLDSGLSARRVQYIRAVLRRALGQAMRWELVARNVAALVTPPRGERHEVRPFDLDEARQFLHAVRGDRLEALYSVTLALGLRQGEALGLRWEDVDLCRGELAVRRALQRVDGQLRLVEPKTRLSRRTIALPAVSVAVLTAHRARQSEERERAAQLWEEYGLIFTTLLGRPLDASSVTHRFQKVLARAGLRRQRFHDLRHACASLLLAQGVSPRVVMEMLGHSHISLTLNTYSHVIPALARGAANLMDAALTGSTGNGSPADTDSPGLLPRLLPAPPSSHESTR